MVPDASNQHHCYRAWYPAVADPSAVRISRRLSSKLAELVSDSDNSLDGDEGWKTEHWQWRYKLPSKLCTYVGRFGWLLRNPGQGYGVEYLVGSPIVGTYNGNLYVNDSPGVEGQCFIYVQDLVQWVWVRKIGNTGKCFYFNFGWNIKGVIGAAEYSHTATYTFSPRIATFK